MSNLEKAMGSPSLMSGQGSFRGGKEDQIDEAKVLVLYVGGTIGMKEVDGVLKPVADYMNGLLKSLPMFYDKETADKLNLPADQFVLPLQENTRIFYQIKEYDPLKDSSNLVIGDWAEMVKDIQDNYTKYDGFVILHGTDTMAYSASALSFMLENLEKPVILTGAQTPMSKFRSDGIDNMLGALYIAGKYDIPEVTLFFNNQLFRGNRTTKRSSEEFDAYASNNFPPLVEMNVFVEVDWEDIFRPKPRGKFSVSAIMNNNVGMLTFFPGITSATVKACLSPPVQGVVLQTYGAGNAPDKQLDIMKEITDACKRGVLIINVTQCSEGKVSASYATGASLLEAGVIPGSDITPEAALTKLGYVLGKEGLTHDERRKLLSTNLRGEITVSHIHEKGFTLKDNKFANAVGEVLRITSGKELKAVKKALFPSMICTSAADGDLQALQHLQSCGGDLTAGDLNGRTALHAAAAAGNVEIVKYLLQNGCSVLARDRFGNSPFTESIRSKNLEIVKLLREAGGHLQQSAKITEAVNAAVKENDQEALKCFQEAGIDIKSAVH